MTTLYEPTVWNEGAPPGISAALLNHIEQGIRAAKRVGEVFMSLQDEPDPGCLKLDGATISRSEFEALFDYVTNKELIGAGKPFGNGDGSTTFVLPDMGQRFPRMPATGAGGATGGQDIIPSHSHINPATGQEVFTGTPSDPPPGAGNLGGGRHTHLQGNTGQAGSGENRPFFYEINFFIAT